MLVRLMTPKRSTPPPEPRYAYDAVAAEIGRIVERGPRGTKKRCAVAIGVDQAAFRHRLTQYRGERFSFEEVGAIAAELGAPTGWPWIKWEAGEAFDSYRKLIAAATQ